MPSWLASEKSGAEIGLEDSLPLTDLTSMQALNRFVQSLQFNTRGEGSQETCFRNFNKTD